MNERQRVSKLMDLYSSVNPWEEFSGCSFQGAVTSIVQSSPSSRRRRAKSDLSASIASVFLPIRANPHHLERTSIIKGTFVFSGEVLNADHIPACKRGDILNHSPAVLDQFVGDWIENAKELGKATIKGMTSPGIDRFNFVLGDRGVGKTFLQNFIISEYAERFDKEKVIWLRLNLVNEFGSYKDDLNDRMAAQCFKIIARYYDSRSQYLTQGEVQAFTDISGFWKRRGEYDFDVKLILSQYIEEIAINEQDKRRMYDELKETLILLQDKQNDNDISPDNLRSDFAKKIYGEAVRRGFTFLLVLDGIDLLQLSRTAKDDYQDRLNSIVNFLGAETIRPLYTLIFAREESKADFERLSIEHAKSYQAPVGADLLVEACNVELMINRKIQYVSKHMPDISTDDIDNFLVCVNKEGEGEGEGSLVGQIATTVGSNLRSASITLSMAALEYSSEHETTYHFTESAMLSGGTYPPQPYTYKFEEYELSRLRVATYAVLEVVYLPSIIGFPYAEGRTVSDNYGDVGFEKYLWGIRVIQLVKIFCEIHARTKSKPNVAKLCELMSCFYGYPEKETKFIVEEFVEMGLLEANSTVSIISNAKENIANNCVSISPKGSHIYGKCIFDPTYLALSAMTMPVPNELISGESREKMLLRRSPVVVGSKEWVKAKVINSIVVYKLLVGLNEKQFERASSANDSEGFFNECKFWEPVSKQLRTKESEVYRIIPDNVSRFIEVLTKAVWGLDDSAALEVMSETKSYFEELGTALP